MQPRFHAWLFLLCFCAAFPVCAEDKEVYEVSIIRLIAAPKEYAQKTVQVVGFLGFGGNAIFFHEEDFKYALLSNGIGIRADPEIRRRLEKLAGQYVIIEGVVDASGADAIAVIPFRIWLTRITRADVWKAGPSPTPTP